MLNINDVPLPIFVYDENLIIVDANVSAIALFGSANFDVLPLAQPDGRVSTEVLGELLGRALSEGRTVDEFMMQKNNGTPVPVMLTNVRTVYNGKNAVTVYINDLTDAKAAEARLIEHEHNSLLLKMIGGEQQMLLETKEAERLLFQEMKDAEQEIRRKLEAAVQAEQKANMEKTRFLARMSHEIRTPMHSILGITETQLQKGAHSEETEEALHRIYSSSNMLLAIINDILDFTKIEAGKMEIVPIPYDTAGMIVSTVQLNHIYLGDKKIEFRLSIDKDLPARLVGDELRVKQILNNILSNAFKYTSEGSVHLSFGMETAEDRDSIVLVIRVKDTGQGMTEEQLSGLGSEFSRYNLDVNRTIEGTGLGLGIAYHLVKVMRGTVSVESELGMGSTFTVRIPQKKGGMAAIGEEVVAGLESLKDIHKPYKKLSKFQPKPMPYGRVLVVDDVEANLYVAEAFLEPYELQVDMVESGIAAIEKIKAGEKYDIIFMDHMMPVMDGIEATKIIRGMGYTLPIVALTANAFSEMAEAYAINGFTDYASKPLEITHMDSFLMRYIYNLKNPA